MIRLEDIRAGQSLEGVEPDLVVTVAAAISIGPGALTLYYKRPDGTLRERLLSRADEATLQVATTTRPWSFDADGEAFKLTAEARRMELAFHFDPMMAVHASNVEPLPHQITAVYEAMLPRQPLRFVLADDPGAGKTIMAGLYIRELILRADARRVLIVAPGSLVEQWRDELHNKFGLAFQIYSRELHASSPSGDPFEDHEQLILRLDQAARSDELQERLCRPGWDLVIFDEAHKLSAHYYGQELQRTRRFALAEKLGARCRHLLLMTATPHNGKEEEFQLFLSLLDADRFFGKFRDGAPKVDTRDIMRRMVKEDLLRFDGTPLFPERRAYTIDYALSPEEAELYDLVTTYVKTQMGKAEALDGRRKVSVGFALTSLQRRLASSPAAIHASLRRRHERLETRLRELRAGPRPSGPLQDAPTDRLPDDEDDLNAAEQERLEETLVDSASAAATLAELESEVLILQMLKQKARDLAHSRRDRKWEELSRILQHDPHLLDPQGRPRKLILFTEHRDTLTYLQERIASLIGEPEAIVTIHGGTPREERLLVQERFRNEPQTRVLIATDAAGEGVNLQVANLMINYDLPWNPNRLEQRFGRIHRIGQTEVCHLWNLVAGQTREGEVYHRLLQKLSVENTALQGRVFDILGEVFEGTSLRDMLLEAIRYGERDDVRARLYQQVDAALDHSRIQAILDRAALAEESLSPERLFAVKEEMDKAEARRLQPYFVRAYFLRAFEQQGGVIHPREAGRYEITHVPPALRDRARREASAPQRDNAPLVRRYERVCFSKDAVVSARRTSLAPANLLHPGHPLVRTVTQAVIEQNSNILRQGALLVDPADDGEAPRLLFLLSHEIRGGDATLLSKRLQFVRVAPDGAATFAGWAPHLDLQPLPAADRPLLDALLAEPWISVDQEQRALSLAAATLAPAHLEEVSARRIAHVDKTLAAVNERLNREIAYLTERWMKLREEQNAGKDVRLAVDNAYRTLTELEGRLERRKAELRAMRHIVSATPVALGGALIIPAGLLARLRASSQGRPADHSPDADPQVKARTERLAMAAVRRFEASQGSRVVDVSAEKCGWDLTAIPPATNGRQPDARHIEVKGRLRGADTLTVTRNEILYALNQADKFVLAIVFVDPDRDDVEGPYYVRRPFDTEPGWGVASWNIEIRALLGRAERMA